MFGSIPRNTIHTQFSPRSLAASMCSRAVTARPVVLANLKSWWNRARR